MQAGNLQTVSSPDLTGDTTHSLSRYTTNSPSRYTIHSPSRGDRPKTKLNMSNEVLPVPILGVEDLEPVIDQCAFSEKINLSGQKLTEAAFDLIINTIESAPGLRRLYVSKDHLTPEQQKRLVELTGNNQQKSLRICPSEGDLIDSIHTNWSAYAEEKRHDHITTGMRETTRKAVDFFFADFKKLPGFVVDFGAGTGNDTIPLAKMGCPLVWALDGEKKSLKILLENVVEVEKSFGNLNSEIICINTPFIDLEITEQADLLIASFTWPYRRPQDFPECWKKCVNTVKVGGYISGQFFGPLTDRNPDPGMTYHTEEELRLLLKDDFEIKWFHKDAEGTAMKLFGGDKPGWGDLFHVVAKRIPCSQNNDIVASL